MDYQTYVDAFRLTPGAEKRQREALGAGEPLLSFILVDEGEISGLRRSLQTQSCSRFEVLTEKEEGLPHQRVVQEDSLHRRALAARGKGILFLPRGSRLTPECVYHLGRALLEGGELVFGDEDTLLHGRRQEPLFKPGRGDFTLLSGNYMGRCVALEKNAYRRCGGLQAWSPEALWDMLLRAEEQGIVARHIPLILLSLPKEKSAPAPWPAQRAMYRRGLGGFAEKSGIPGVFALRPAVKKPSLVSMLLPCSGTLFPLKRLLEWVERRSVYPYYEWILLCPDRLHEDTRRYLHALEKNGAARVLLSKASLPVQLNMGAREARGECLLFMEEGCLPRTADFMGWLFAWAMAPGVAAVGGKRELHPGVALLPGGLPGVAPTLIKEGSFWTDRLRSVSCLPAGGTMLRRQVFLSAGGFDEDLTEGGHMEALCLKLGRCVYCPQAVFELEGAAVRNDPLPDTAPYRDIFRPLFIRGDPLFTPQLRYGSLELNLPPRPPEPLQKKNR